MHFARSRQQNPMKSLNVIRARTERGELFEIHVPLPTRPTACPCRQTARQCEARQQGTKYKTVPKVIIVIIIIGKHAYQL